MIPAQQAVELALQAAERSGRCDETIVIVTDRARGASLRWAGNSMTTNRGLHNPQHGGHRRRVSGSAATSAPSDRATWIRLRWLPWSNPPRMRRSELRPLRGQRRIADGQRRSGRLE